MVTTPEILHESQGLTIRRNLRNEFVVASLHYTADPRKRKPEWRREAAAGMTPEKFAREYEMDASAVLGAKVFPEITSKRTEIVVPEPYPDFGPHTKYWGGFDYGTRNPASFHVYTIADGVLYSIWELYEPCKNIPDFVEKMKQFQYWHSIKWIAADPSLWAPTQQQENGNLTSIKELFERQGVRNFIKGIQDEDAWIAMMRQYWKDDPTFKILGCCPNQIREFETAIYVSQSERQLLSSSYRETIQDKDNHSLDDCKYLMLNRPAPTTTSSWKDPGHVKQWGWPNRTPTNHNPKPATQKPSFERNGIRYY